MERSTILPKEKHRRFQEIIDTPERFEDLANLLIIEEKDQEDIKFLLQYLRSLRKSIYETIFEGMGNRLPPLVILSRVLVYMGVEEDYLKGVFGFDSTASGIVIAGKGGKRGGETEV
jgi:hypothetical protein